MNNRWSRFISLLLSLATVLSMLPAGFALDTEAPDAAPQTSEETALTEEETAGQQPEESEEAEEPAQEPEAPVEEPAQEPEAPSEEPAQEPEAPVEEPAQEPEAPVEEPAQEPEAPSEEPAQEPEEEIATASEEEGQAYPVPASTDGCSQLTLTGTKDYASAFALQKLINSARAKAGTASLTMDQTVLDCAMTRAVESAVFYSDSRPSGADWSTVLGDASVNATAYDQILAYNLSSAQAAYDALTGNASNNAKLMSGDYSGVGVGCFYQADGTRYWVLILFRGPYSAADQPSNHTGAFSVDYLPGKLGTGTLRFDKSSVNVGMNAQASFTVSNGKGSFTPDAVTYTSSNAAVVSVNAQGVLSALTPGTATITACLKSDTSVKASAAITSVLYLPAPTLKGIKNSDSGITVAWSAVAGATGYQVWRSLRSGSWSKVDGLIATVPAGQLAYTDKNVQSGITYYYTIRPYFESNQKVTLGKYEKAGIGIIRLTTPKLKAAQVAETGITIGWGKVTGADGYYVYRKQGTEGWKAVGKLTSAASSFTDVNVVKGTQYCYTVRAYSGTTRSNYVAAGVTATASTTIKTEWMIARANVYYRATPSTSGKVIDTILAGSKVSVLSGWSTTAGGNKWYMTNVNGTNYYIMASYLLATPKATALVNAEKGFLLTWNAESNADGYYIFRKTGTSSWVLVQKITSNKTTSYVDPDATLTSGTSYTYTVRSYSGKILSRYDTAGITGEYLKTPSLLSAAASGNAIKVSWEKVSGATGYVVYRKTSGSGWSIVGTITSGSTTSYTDNTATALTEYIYTVRATHGKLYSYFVTAGIKGIVVPADKITNYVVVSEVKYRTGPSTSYKVLGTLKQGTVVKIITGWSSTANGYTWARAWINNTLCYIATDFLMATPGMKSVTATSNGVTVTWNKVANAKGYILYRKVSGGKWGQVVILSSGNTTSYTDTSLVSGTTYYYTVRATNGTVLSGFQSPGPSICYLSTPTLSGISAGANGITVNWSRVTGAKGYYIYRKPSGGSWKRIAVVNSGSTLSYRDTTNLIKDTTYIYTVRAFSGSYYSMYVTAGISAKSTVTLNPTTKDYVVVNATLLRYRSGPGTNYPEKGTLKQGEVVKVVTDVSVTVNGTVWYMIYKNGGYYYVSSKYLKAV